MADSVDSQKKVIVIGAGVIGTSTALELSELGYDVTVIERFPLAAQFCSMANAGVVRDESVMSGFKSLESEYTHSALPIEAIKSLLPTFKPTYNSYAFIDPAFFSDLSSYKWIFKFLKSHWNTKPEDYSSTKDAYYAYCYSALSSRLYGQKDGSFALGYGRIFPPLAVLPLKNPADLYRNLLPDESRNALQIEDITSKQPTRNQIDTLAVELYPRSMTADCHAYTNSIVNSQQSRNGKQIDFRFNTQVKQILVDQQDTVYGVQLDNDSILKANTVVICAGVLTANMIERRVYRMTANNLQQTTRIKLPYVPIVPLQGWSISVPCPSTERNRRLLGTMVYFPSHIYGTRVNAETVRFAACGYFRSSRYAMKAWDEMQSIFEKKQGVQSNIVKAEKFERKILDLLESNIRDNLLSIYDIDEQHFNENKVEWKGFRPYTPDSLPIVDRVPSVNGLYVNAGHGHLGWCMSAGTARLMSKLVDNSASPAERELLNLLSLSRF